MATIQKRGQKWRAQVRRKGCPPQSRTFTHKADAQKWARHMETEADRKGLPVDRRELETLKVADLLMLYRETVTLTKRGQAPESVRLNVMVRRSWAKLPLASVTGSHFARYRDERLKTCKPETVRKELALLHNVFEVARREWSIPLDGNPLADVRKPPANKPRNRRLEGGEADRLVKACSTCRNPFILPMVRLAIETGMRRGEVLKARWEGVDLEARTLRLEETKNGHPQDRAAIHKGA